MLWRAKAIFALTRTRGEIRALSGMKKDEEKRLGTGRREGEGGLLGWSDSLYDFINQCLLN